ncbi:MAG TPA: hypothetical protein VNN62_05210 [Methylomirabilota bacterium]|jgi:hypothetical protein|nr:hypothetical protein [Methylomirabilota bacterium]
MLVRLLSIVRKSRAFALLLSSSLLFTPCVFAQTFGVGAGENGSSDTSRTPFRIKLSGFLNTRPEEGARGIKLGISAFQETYDFELIKAEAVDDPHISQTAILQQVGKYPVDFNLIGPRELLSKIGQSEPGAPLLLIGFFQQRNRTLQLQSVEVIGMTNY